MYEITDKYEVKEFDKEILLFPMQSSGEKDVLAMNRTSSEILRMIKDGMEVSEIQVKLEKKYNVEKIEKDLQEVIEILLMYEVIKKCNI